MARVKGGAARGVRWRVAWRVLGGLAALALVAGALAAPTLADGYAALQWTRHYAAGFGGERPFERVRQCGRWAARAIDNLAPLPAAGEAATLALQTGRQFEAERPAAVLALYTEVRVALERQQASAWRRRGLTALVDEARTLEQGARAATLAAGRDNERPAVSSPAGSTSSPSPSSSPSPGLALPPGGSPSVPSSLAVPSPSPGVSPGPAARVSPPPSSSPSPAPKATPALPRGPGKPKSSQRAKPRPRPTGGGA